MEGEESGDVEKSETATAGVGTQMLRVGSIPAAFHPAPYNLPSWVEFAGYRLLIIALDGV